MTNTAWAFATVGQPDAQLFTGLAKTVERRVGEFNAQDLANTAWAFATVNRLDEKLFVALAGESGGATGERLQCAGSRHRNGHHHKQAMY